MTKYEEALNKVLYDNPKAELITSDIHSSIGLLQELVNKETPKKPIYEGDGYDNNGLMIYDIAYCPICNHEFEEDSWGWNDKYCPNCGQALKWEEEKEND